MITFVAGVPCSGKTEYIKRNYPNTQCVDVYDFQQKLPFITVDTVIASYVATYEKAFELSKNGDVIIEHTLLKRLRRQQAIEALREMGYNGDINIVFLMPSRELLIERATKREATKDIKSFVDKHIELVEKPTEDEGFTSIKIVKE
jgi:predicted kinase